MSDTLLSRVKITMAKKTKTQWKSEDYQHASDSCFYCLEILNQFGLSTEVIM